MLNKQMLIAIAIEILEKVDVEDIESVDVSTDEQIGGGSFTIDINYRDKGKGLDLKSREKAESDATIARELYGRLARGESYE